ncbi:putative virion structural protein [Pseudomonas phage OBP]|uniref:internal head protein n=1 Tax=Pseudomonas phage OBP TaxID=1124849 RepID=UPI000240D5EF|nr:internal head protein [Pseudomonas phage OBP]AEV89699.1 putative virion structural protein [Pseudomonas phage OBP]
MEITFDTAGFESLMSDFDHVVRLTSGFETLHEDINFDGPLGDDLEYTTTVLKLNDLDLEAMAGQEGFMDGVKKAGVKIKEFIKQLIAYIRSWFKPKEADVKAVENMFKQLRDKPTPESILKAGQDQAIKGTDESPKGPGNISALSDYNAFRKKKTDELRNQVRRLAPEEKTAVKEAADEIDNNADVKDKLVMVSTNIEARVKGVVDRAAGQIMTHLKEIERIDPTEETRNRLGFAIDIVKSTMEETLAGNQDLMKNIRFLINARVSLSECKDKATVNLDKMAANTDEGDRDLNRAVSVTQELIKAVEAACNGVLNLDTAWRKTETNAIDEVTAAIFKRAKATISGSITPALEELTRISLHGR